MKSYRLRFCAVFLRASDGSVHYRWPVGFIGHTTSQKSGLVAIHDLSADGNYFQLVETKAPVGYIKSQGQWRLTFDGNGSFDLANSVGLQENQIICYLQYLS